MQRRIMQKGIFIFMALMSCSGTDEEILFHSPDGGQTCTTELIHQSFSCFSQDAYLSILNNVCASLKMPFLVDYSFTNSCGADSYFDASLICCARLSSEEG